jgi:hypothetical protein
MGASSSSIPSNDAIKLIDASVLTNQLGSPRGGCEEHISKFSLSYETKVYQPLQERTNSQRLLIADFARHLVRCQQTTWNLHTTQPRYFAPTCSEVVNLTGLLKTKDYAYRVVKDICLQESKYCLNESKR